MNTPVTTIYDAVKQLWPNPDGMALDELEAAYNSLKTLADGFAVLVRQRRYPPEKYADIEGAYKRVTK